MASPEGISFSLDNTQQVAAFLQGIQPAKVIITASKRVALEFNNKVKENIQKEIYDKPQSLHYVRTGRAKRGNIIEDYNGGLRIRWDSTLAPRATLGVTGGLTKTGARKRSAKEQKEPTKNYTPMLNRNKKIGRLNTHFFDNAVTWIKDQADKFLQLTFNDVTGYK